MRGLITILGSVPDPRTGNARRHDLLDVLTIALVASICGCQTCVDMADFAEDRETLFREFLRLEHGLPSHGTVSRLFRLIDPEALSSAFGGFLDALGADGRGVVAIVLRQAQNEGQDPASLLRPGRGWKRAARGHRVRHRHPAGTPGW